MRTLLIALILLFAPAAGFAQTSISGQQDIGELMQIAENEFDLSAQDAVILFNGQKIHWTPDRRRIKFVHQIIWIGTTVGINRYADHRIPYDDERCTFNTITVRTWRDNQWWETGETGKVETLPSALSSAYDYTNMREMMLLHNGVELPCILEVAYSIEDKSPFRGGVDGLWYFDNTDPVVISWFGLGLPKNMAPNVLASENIPPPEIEPDSGPGLDTHWWKTGPQAPRPRPYIENRTTQSPHIFYSTWSNWGELGNYIKTIFEGKQSLDKKIITQLDSLLKDARTYIERAEFIADFIKQKVKFINYPESYWFGNPREAALTYNTAYGHRFDRAVLAAAMFKYAGLEIFPAFSAGGFGAYDYTVPTLAYMNGIDVWVSGENIEAVYNPESSSLKLGLGHIFGRTLWLPGVEDKPGLRMKGMNEQSVFEVTIELKFDSTGDSLFGVGYLNANNCLCPYGQMVGLDDETETFIEQVASGILGDIEVTEHNVSRFDLFGITAGFKIKSKAPEKDDYDRLPININDPAGGLLDHLTDDINVLHIERKSNISLQCPMIQKIIIKLNLEELNLVYTPENQTLENQAGHFSIVSEIDDKRLTLTRQLTLFDANYPASVWPDLRGLIIAEKHERNRIILLKQNQEE